MRKPTHNNESAFRETKSVSRQKHGGRLEEHLCKPAARDWVNTWSGWLSRYWARSRWAPWRWPEETINALWVVIAAVCVYLIAYRYYSRFIAKKVFQLDPTRMTPAWKHNDGLDYVPTNKHVLFGHHFAAIAGAGPLVGPVLAAQMGYLPGMLWILAGVVFAGAVQDFTILFISTRRDGRSLGDLVKSELGKIPGVIALFGAFMIMVIILAVLALIVVKALTHSPWGTFTVAATIPIALFMGVYLRYIRPGKIGEVSIIGFVGLMAAIVFGQDVAAHPVLGPLFDFDGKGLTWILIVYGFIASVLPVWLLLARATTCRPS